MLIVKAKRLVAFILAVNPVLADVAINPNQDLNWGNRYYSALAPPPFNRIDFELTTSQDGVVTDIGISVDGQNVAISPTIYSGLDQPGRVWFLTHV